MTVPTSAAGARDTLDGASRTAQARPVNGDTDRAWLDWWANSATRLGSIEVELEAGATDAGDTRGRLVADSFGTLEDFEFLCSLDPVFSLRFADGSMVAVRVAATGDRREVTLHEHEGPAACAFSPRLDV